MFLPGVHVRTKLKYGGISYFVQGYRALRVGRSARRAHRRIAKQSHQSIAALRQPIRQLSFTERMAR